MFFARNILLTSSPGHAALGQECCAGRNWWSGSVLPKTQHDIPGTCRSDTYRMTLSTSRVYDSPAAPHAACAFPHVSLRPAPARWSSGSPPGCCARSSAAPAATAAYYCRDMVRAGTVGRRRNAGHYSAIRCAHAGLSDSRVVNHKAYLSAVAAELSVCTSVLISTLRYGCDCARADATAPQDMQQK